MRTTTRCRLALTLFFGAQIIGCDRSATDGSAILDTGDATAAGLFVGSPSKDDLPVPGNYGGTGATVMAVYRKSTAEWFIPGQPVVKFGEPGRDLPAPGDYDGVGKTQIATYRPPTKDGETGQWFVAGHGDVVATFGGKDQVPVPGDYDGVGKTQFALYEPATAKWYVAGHGEPVATFGSPGEDLPAPLAYDSKRTQVASYRQKKTQWFVGGHGDVVATFGGPDDLPAPGNYDNTGKAQFAAFRPSTGEWFVAGRGSATKFWMQAAPASAPAPVTFTPLPPNPTGSTTYGTLLPVAPDSVSGVDCTCSQHGGSDARNSYPDRGCGESFENCENLRIKCMDGAFAKPGNNACLKARVRPTSPGTGPVRGGGGQVTVQVLDEAEYGKLVNAQVQLIPSTPGATVMTGFTESDGLATFDIVRPGTYSVQAVGDGFNLMEAGTQLRVLAGGRYNVSMLMRRAKSAIAPNGQKLAFCYIDSPAMVGGKPVGPVTTYYAAVNFDGGSNQITKALAACRINSYRTFDCTADQTTETFKRGLAAGLKADGADGQCTPKL